MFFISKWNKTRYQNRRYHLHLHHHHHHHHGRIKHPSSKLQILFFVIVSVVALLLLVIRRQNILMASKDYNTITISKLNNKCIWNWDSLIDEDNNNGFMINFVPNDNNDYLENNDDIITNDNDKVVVPIISGTAKSGSGCIISMKYKFVYIHVLKSGGSAIETLLRQGLCQGHDNNNNNQDCDTDIFQVVNCHDAYNIAHDYNNNDKNYSKKRDNFIIWTFVRNPFSRIYSGYAMADSMRGPHQPPIDFETEFVHWNQKQRKLASITSPFHYTPQYKFIANRDFCPIVHYIGRLESFDKDWQTVMQIIFRNRGWYLVYNKLLSRTTKQGDENTFGSSRVQLEFHGDLSLAFTEPSTRDAVVKEYATDFELFHYDTQKIPNSLSNHNLNQGETL